MYDLDAPTGSALWHWMVYNIPPSAKSFVSDSDSFTENKLPKGATNGLNDIGVRGYFGACPPEGQLHKYFITVYALNNIIQVILLKYILFKLKYLLIGQKYQQSKFKSSKNDKSYSIL